MRHCVETAGGNMCVDECSGNSGCERPDLKFTCDLGGSIRGKCKPPDGFTCIPSAQFERGTKQPMECCTATGDGIAGLECEGSMCIAIGDSPFVCTHGCELPKDCPSGTVCQQITDDRKECIPANRPYQCK
jgi:hypothetical protein